MKLMCNFAKQGISLIYIISSTYVNKRFVFPLITFKAFVKKECTFLKTEIFKGLTLLLVIHKNHTTHHHVISLTN